MVHRYSKVHLIIGALCLVLILPFAIATLTKPDTIIPIEITVNRGRRIIVVRFPQATPGSREQIMISLDEELTLVASRVFVAKYGEQERGVVTDLSPQAVHDWAALRAAWCQDKPSTTSTSSDVFEIAVRCPSNKDPLGDDIVVFRVPARLLSSTLRRVLEDIPSPGCDEPLCGW